MESFFITVYNMIVSTLIILLGMYIYTRLTLGRCTSKAKLDGKTIVITGGNRGIGYHTAMDLAKRGGRVFVACRNATEGERTVKEIREATGNTNVHFRQLDLASFNSIKTFANDLKKEVDKLHVLINNAAIAGTPTKVLTEDGFEMQFQINYLGPFLLTHLLLPLIKNAAPSRIVNVSSAAHMATWSIDFDNLNSEKNFNSSQIYNKTKLFNILFTRELAQQLEGTGVTVNALHPGVIFTGLAVGLLDNFKLPRPIHNLTYWILNKTRVFFTKSEEEGAQTSIFAAVDESLDNVTAAYFQDCKKHWTAPAARNRKLASKLWSVSVKLAGIE